MPHYKITIFFGEVELHARIEAPNRKAAADRIVENLISLPDDNPAHQAYVNYRKECGGKGSFNVKVEDMAPPPPIRKGRFRVEPSKKKKGWWVVTDLDNLVVITFKEHHFHETQRITPLNDTTPDPLELATVLRECAEWLRAEQYDLIF